MDTTDKIIEQTDKWIKDVVIGCNFCPFAAAVVKQKTLQYVVDSGDSMKDCLGSFALELERLDEAVETETSLIIIPQGFEDFSDYLDLVDNAEKLLVQEGYEGIYQVASFHPQYCFAGADETDAANYTNRSPYPMLHILREASIDKALEHYKNPDDIPQRNIDFARQKGLAYLQILRDNCL